MFNIELIRQDIDKVKVKLTDRNFATTSIDLILQLDTENRNLKNQHQQLLASKNKISKEIGILIQSNQKDKIPEIQAQVASMANEIEALGKKQTQVEKELNHHLALLPNLCWDDVPVGKDESQNQPIKHYGTPKQFNFAYLPHYELGQKLKILDLSAAAKLSGSRFAMYINDGAKLYRALQQFTLDHNTQQGFNEILPPAIISGDCLFATGQLPKFYDDLYHLNLDDKEMFLSPTAEVQLVNIHRDEIVTNLPIRYTANTPCFRSEAGSAGKDTKGVIRLHQFYKSELVTICSPETSWQEHEYITRTAELVLEKLELPYRRLLLCTGDTGFGSAKTYDLEVWLPSYQAYKEISSCSNCLDFQARRASIRTKQNNNNVLVHTLNGSSLAIDRLWVAIVENYQQADGTILIPNVLQPYMGGQKIIK